MFSNEKKILNAQDLQINPAFACYNKSKNLKDYINHMQELLSRMLPLPLPFFDKKSFDKWVNDFLPWIVWENVESFPGCLSMFFMVKPLYSISIETLIVDMIKHWLMPHEEITILSFQHMLSSFSIYPHQSFFVGECKVLVLNKKQADLIENNLNLFRKELIYALTSNHHVKFFLQTKTFPLVHKMSIIQEALIKLIKRFADDFDESIFQWFAIIQSLTSSEFREQRSYSHLIRIVVSQFLVSNYLHRELNIFPEKRYMKIIYTRAELIFPFGTKSVLGLSIGLNIFHKYEFFDAEHIVRAAEKFIPKIRAVPGTFYRFALPHTSVVTFYIELEKEEGTSFTLDEKKTLKQNLEEELKKRIETLVPSLFMIRNEEEAMRNILMLLREIKSYDDIPQMMVTFDQHSQEDIIFNIILLRVKREDSLPLQDLFKNSSKNIHFILDRIQIVSYLDKQYPIEANVFRLKLIKQPSFLRMDFSVNLYLARQEVVSFITYVMGEVRDYNGGMIVKQGELFSQFKRLFQDVSSRNQELLENFFYSLNPIEAQAIIPLQTVSFFFQTFLHVVEYDCLDENSYIVEFKQENDVIVAIIRSHDSQYRTFVEESLRQTQIEESTLISSVLTFEGHLYLSYLYDQHDKEKIKSFQEAIKKALNDYQVNKNKPQTLRLPCCHVVSLDPRIGGDQESSLLVKFLFDGLMRMGDDGTLQCSIAESYTVSQNKKRYIFKIRESYWSDGSRLIAYDFEYAWKTSLLPDFFSPFSHIYYPIKNARAAKEGKVSLDDVGVKAIDEQTLVIDLENPIPYFIELMANTLYSPVNHVVDKIHPNWAMQKNQYFVCNGPFCQSSHSHDFVFEFTKNYRYWNVNNIKFDRILFSHVKGKVAVNMLENNQLDFMKLDLMTFDKVCETGLKVETFPYSLFKISWQCFNVNRFPFTNHKMRLAFSMAINRKEISQIIPLFKNCQPAFTPLPLQLTQHLNSPFLIKEDVEQAQYYFQEGLKELGISLENFPIIYITVLLQDEKLAFLMKSQWERVLKIRCEIKSLSRKDCFKELVNENFQIGGVFWNSWLHDPIYTLQNFKSREIKTNFTGWENAEFTKLLNLSDQSTDSKVRRNYLAEAEKILIQNAVVIPMFYDMGYFVKNQNLVLNASVSNGNIDFSKSYFRVKKACLKHHEIVQH